jgi:DNA repair protein RecN (Recombination protein N)
MLNELRIKDFAIIDRLELRFKPGFNVITGETGAGKSILIDAVGLLMGGPAEREMVRAGAERALIEGVFEMSGTKVVSVLSRENLEGDEPQFVTLTREVRSSSGRSMCRVNGVTVRQEIMREIGEHLVDIHGQGEHLSLLRPREHINLLDRYAGLERERATFAEVVHELEAVRRELNALLRDEAALARRADLLQFQLDEIIAAAPKRDEDEELRRERTQLANAETLASLAEEAQRALYDGDEIEASAVDLLAQATGALEKLAKIDPTMAEAYNLAEGVSAQVEDLARTLRTYREDIEFNPKRLDEIELRIDVLNRLKRKYGGTIESVLAWAANVRAELETLTNSEARVEALRADEEQLLRRAGEMAAALSVERLKATGQMADQIVAELDALRMEKAQFQVDITHQEDPTGLYVGEKRLAFDSTGVDRVEFLVSANPGEPLRPLVKVASGGETARLMLALKTVFSRADTTPTLIFDEIDQGIGGRVGSVVGQKLWGLSSGHQVLVITHLAQLAGFGDAHYQVSKQVEDDRTFTLVSVLDEHARVGELAAMLGAQGESARQSAVDLLAMARHYKTEVASAGVSRG